MTRNVAHHVEDADAGLRLDVLCAKLGCYASRSAAGNAIEKGKVLVNGRQKPKKYEVKSGDTIIYEMQEQTESVLTGQDIPLDVRFEDDDMMVISKQIGLVCHPSQDHEDGTLVNALIYHCGADHLCNVQGEYDRLGIVHRLDMDTSGLMLVGKSDAAGHELMAAIKDRRVDRHYLALVHGIIVYDSGMIDAPITRSTHDRTRMAVRDTLNSRDALTSFQVVERFAAKSCDNGYTLIDCKLYTGRTHQIRVHMEYAKHPLVGESVYTAGMPKDVRAQLGLERQFLHSYRLKLEHPVSGDELQFIDNVPRDLQDVLDSLGSRSTGRTAFGEEIFEKLRNAPRPIIEGVQTFCWNRD